MPENNKWTSKAERIVEILLVEDNVPHEELESIREWLIADDGHADEKAEIFVRKFTENIKRGENREAALRLWPALAVRLGIPSDKAVGKSAVRRPLYRQAAFRIAAVAVPAILLVAGALALFNTPAETAQTTEIAITTITAAPSDTVSVETEGGKQHILPDNSKVRLAEGSTLRYAENFEQERYVELEGEAHFNVAQAADNFEVHTGDMKISVLGTIFKVDSHAGVIDLYHGSVSVEAAGNHLVMAPGQHLSYDRGTGHMEVSHIPLPSRYYDEMPGLIFEGTLLSEVLAKVGHDYGVVFRIENNAALATQEIYGDFTGFGSIEELMTMLQRISGRFTYEITAHEVIIREGE